MRDFLGFLSTVLFLNCSYLDKNSSPFNILEIETLVSDSLMNIRALELTQKSNDQGCFSFNLEIALAPIYGTCHVFLGVLCVGLVQQFFQLSLR